MACERKFNESEATTGFFLLLGQQGNKAVLDWVMKEGLIPSRYECPKCKKDMRLVERKGTIDGFEWRCRVQSKENPHFVCRCVRKGTWFSDSRLSICVILRLTSDEAHFWLNGYVNKQNYRICSEANPQVYVETPLHPEKLTVCCALWACGIIGPYFFKNDEGHNVTVNGDRYRAMITNFFIPELNNHDVQELWF
ncbi:uncharacterized protein TNCV_744701 [Trichonephila clavipes]|nr:uncharacterized protein TNCV_744701 [Trichonephila clavipes]